MTFSSVLQYHDGTKHHFNRFARSLGYLDWASQPNPFRAFSGAPRYPLHPIPSAGGDYVPPAATYDELFDGYRRAEPLSAGLIGDVLRHSLGLSAWKQYRESRWSLRVNPSSGNLHPTEAYVVCGGIPGLAGTPAVYHYAADQHALEQRSAFDASAWAAACGQHDPLVLVALTSIHWREAWKYGERAFRYCQHDLGHAIAAVGIASSLVGWRAVVLPAWSQQSIAALTGIDRDEDFFEAEREEAGCLLAIVPSHEPQSTQRTQRIQDVRSWPESPGLIAAIKSGHWTGRANQLSEDHVEWTFIDEAAQATRDPGRPDVRLAAPGSSDRPGTPDRGLDARTVILQRRSAVAFDGRSTIDRSRFLGMLRSILPERSALWNVLWWPPAIHLAIFVHRVDGLSPGLYLLPRDIRAFDRLRSACGREFLWERADEDLPLFTLAPGDCRALAKRLSCDQDIAADGFFSLGMIADVEASLTAHGEAFYRHLFWESGVVGQALYLEAEAVGARATGIGCFYDDPVHDVLGLQGHAFQSLYHFTVGMPVEDTRLMTKPGYDWEIP